LPTFIWAFEKLEVPQIAKWPEKVGKSPSLEDKSGQMWHHCGTSKGPKSVENRVKMTFFSRF
jgi:hypothetical protein